MSLGIFSSFKCVTFDTSLLHNVFLALCQDGASGFVVDKAMLRVELRFALITGGAQFAMTYGQVVMVTLSAKSLGSLQLVHNKYT